MQEYRIVRMKGFWNHYKIEQKTGFWIFKWWEKVYSSLTLKEAQDLIRIMKDRAEWVKKNPVAKKDTVVETFKI